MGKAVNYTAVAGGAFLTGLIAGTLLDKNTKHKLRRQLTLNSGKAERWFVSRREVSLERIEQKVNEVKSLLEKNLADPVPDLYRATESLTLSDEDILDG